MADKKGFLTLLGFLMLFLLWLAPVTSAKDLYNEWHYSEDTFTVDGEVIMLTHYDFYDSTVIMTVNKNTYVIPEGGCKESATKKYCITEIFQDLSSADDDDPIKFEGGEAYAGIKVLISTRGPELEVERKFSTTTPDINQEVIVTVTIENDGVEGTDSFIYEETFPQGVVLTSFSEGIEATSRTLKYDLNLLAKSEKSLIYRFKVTDYLDFSSSAKYNYTYAGSKVSSTTKSTAIKVKKPYELTASLSPKVIEANSEKSILTVDVDDTSSEDINVLELLITVPPEVLVLETPAELTRNNNIYSWKGTIKSEPAKTMTFELKAVKSGEHQIPISLNLKDYTGKEFSDNKTVTLESNIDELEPILSVIETTVAEGGIFRVAFSVKNPNEKIGFRNIKARLKSEILPEFSAELPQLMAGQVELLILNDTLSAPFVDEKKKFDIEALGTYETTTNEYFNFSKKASLTVTPVNDIITISQNIDKREVVQGGNITLTVNIKNNNKETIQVGVYDDYPSGLQVSGGKTSETVFFDNSGTKEAYTYKLDVPLDYPVGNITITTLATVGGKNYAGNKTITIKVNPKPVEKINQTIPEQPGEQGTEKQENLQNNTAEPGQQEEPEKEPGIISKIFTEISEFFKRLFGKK